MYLLLEVMPARAEAGRDERSLLAVIIGVAVVSALRVTKALGAEL